MKKLFSNRNKELENEITAYLNAVTKGGLIYKEGIRDYLNGREEAFELRKKEMVVIEQAADDHLREIKRKLYAYNLIPDSSGDILELTDSLDDLVDTANHTLQHLSIEKPVFPNEIKKPFEELMVVSCQAADELMKGVWSFFQNTGMVEDFVTKASFYESETDKKEEAIARLVFQSVSIEKLSQKIQLRYFIQQVAMISDIAEGIGLKLSVFQLKRQL